MRGFDDSGRVVLDVAVGGHGNSPWSLAFSPSGDHLATDGRDGHLRLVEAGSGRVVLDVAIGNPGNSIWSLAFSPSGTDFHTPLAQAYFGSAGFCWLSECVDRSEAAANGAVPQTSDEGWTGTSSGRTPCAPLPFELSKSGLRAGLYTLWAPVSRTDLTSQGLSVGHAGNDEERSAQMWRLEFAEQEG